MQYGYFDEKTRNTSLPSRIRLPLGRITSARRNMARSSQVTQAVIAL